MRLLLDTHTLFWAVEQPTRIGVGAMKEMQNPANDRLLSAATIWELAIKVGQGKLTLSMPYRQWLETCISDLALVIVPISVEHGERYTVLPPHHKDPFDRLMIEQSLVDGIPIVGVDPVFDRYGVTRVW